MSRKIIWLVTVSLLFLGCQKRTQFITLYFTNDCKNCISCHLVNNTNDYVFFDTPYINIENAEGQIQWFEYANKGGWKSKNKIVTTSLDKRVRNSGDTIRLVVQQNYNYDYNDKFLNSLEKEIRRLKLSNYIGKSNFISLNPKEHRVIKYQLNFKEMKGQKYKLYFLNEKSLISEKINHSFKKIDDYKYITDSEIAQKEFSFEVK